MNRREFDEWLDRYCTLFPETSAWIARIPDETRGPMVEAWASLLSDVEPRDARAATDAMFAGDDPQYPALGVMFGDREKTASHVRRLAMRVRNGRLARESEAKEKRSTEDDRRQHGHFRYKHSMGGLFRALVGWVDEGVPREEANRRMRAMADELPAKGDRGYQPAEGYGDLFSA